MDANLPVKEYLRYIEQGNIPPYTTLTPNFRLAEDEWLNHFQARKFCTERGLWVKIDRQYIKSVAAVLKGQRVLEVMAGRGWLAKGLSEHGITIRCTDNYKWAKQHSKSKNMYPITRIGAVKAVEKYGADYDVLLCSWPPYADPTIIDVARKWGTKPILYIGERCGCNAPEEFCEHFHAHKHIDTPQWDGLHDDTILGVYDESKPLEDY